jgi:hypothetical protein
MIDGPYNIKSDNPSLNEKVRFNVTTRLA